MCSSSVPRESRRLRLTESPQAPPRRASCRPLRGAVVLPMTVAPLGVSRPLSVEAINRASPAIVWFCCCCSRTTRTSRRSTICTASAPWPSSGRWPRRRRHAGARRRHRPRARRVPARRARRAHGAAQAAARAAERAIEIDAHVRRLQELVDRALSLATGPVARHQDAGLDARRSAADRLPARQPARHEGRRTSSSCSRKTASRSSSTPCRWRSRARSKSSSSRDRSNRRPRRR